MAVGRRRTRRLLVEGRAFLWRCDFHEPLEKFSADYVERGTTWRPDVLTVRPEEGPHRLLTVTWPACQGPIVKPRLVRACVQEALRRGWLAQRPTLTLAGSDVSAPGAGPE